MWNLCGTLCAGISDMAHDNVACRIGSLFVDSLAALVALAAYFNSFLLAERIEIYTTSTCN